MTGECSRKVIILNFWSGKSFYVLVLASGFIEFSSAVIAADSNKVAHSIRCAIYGNSALVPKRKKNIIRGEMIAKSEVSKTSAMLAALTIPPAL